MEFFLAFIGGMILNIMPCVFPVLSIKILSLLKHSSSNVLSALSYTAGILASLFCLSGTLILLRNIGFIVGWGYNLQSPMFVILLTYLLFLVGLNFSNFFSIPNFTVKIPGINNILSSFFTGTLAVLVATPCTAPFMATAIGFAFSQPPLTALLTFQFLGLGLAFPFLLCAIFPKVLSFLPPPGNWMKICKELLAFPMYISTIWLLWVVIKQTDANLILTVTTGLVLIIFTIWVWRIIRNCTPSWRHFWLVILIFANFIPLKASYDLINNKHKANHVIFSKASLDRLLENNKKVLVVVTADWCITCKVNEQLVFSTNVIQEELKQNKITYLLADWTKRDEKITEYIKSFNRIGVPLYILYNSKGKHKVLPQLLTQKMALEEFRRLK